MNTKHYGDPMDKWRNQNRWNILTITDGPKILKTLTYNQPNERYLGIIGVVADTFTNNSNFGREIDV